MFEPNPMTQNKEWLSFLPNMRKGSITQAQFQIWERKILKREHYDRRNGVVSDQWKQDVFLVSFANNTQDRNTTPLMLLSSLLFS